MVKYACDICERLYSTIPRAELCESFGVMPTISIGSIFGLDKQSKKGDSLRQAVLILDPYKDEGDHHKRYWGMRHLLEGSDPLYDFPLPKHLELFGMDRNRVYVGGFEIPDFNELSDIEFVRASNYFNKCESSFPRLRLPSEFRKGTRAEVNPKNIPTDKFR